MPRARRTDGESETAVIVDTLRQKVDASLKSVASGGRITSRDYVEVRRLHWLLGVERSLRPPRRNHLRPLLILAVVALAVLSAQLVHVSRTPIVASLSAHGAAFRLASTQQLNHQVRVSYLAFSRIDSLRVGDERIHGGTGADIGSLGSPAASLIVLNPITFSFGTSVDLRAPGHGSLEILTDRSPPVISAQVKGRLVVNAETADTIDLPTVTRVEFYTGGSGVEMQLLPTQQDSAVFETVGTDSVDLVLYDTEAGESHRAADRFRFASGSVVFPAVGEKVHTLSGSDSLSISRARGRITPTFETENLGLHYDGTVRRISIGGENAMPNLLSVLISRPELLVFSVLVSVLGFLAELRKWASSNDD